MLCGVIGSTTGSGPVSLGSSPSGATKFAEGKFGPEAMLEIRQIGVFLIAEGP